MTQYLFVFGRTPALAALELASFFPGIVNIWEGLALVSPDEHFDPEEFIGKVGGTVKIGIVRGKAAEVSAEAISNVLGSNRSGRINFGISSYLPNFPVTDRLLSQIKVNLEEAGFSARFISGKNGEPLTSVVVEKQKLTELILAEENSKILVAETVAVQPFEQWNERDYGRPYADPHAGMLPPKVARMAVNIGISQRSFWQTSQRVRPESDPGQARMTIKPVLLDPFCGMGTILAEALLSGCKVIGGDQSQEVIDKAKANLEWLLAHDSRNRGTLIPGISDNWKLFVSDATHISDKVEPNSVDVVVTEPFMGIAREKGIIKSDQSDQFNELKNKIKGLEKLYIGCLRDWQKILKQGGKVVIALPEYAISGREFFVKKVIDNCENLGYTVQTGPIEYSRPQAVVRRKFYVLKKL